MISHKASADRKQRCDDHLLNNIFNILGLKTASEYEADTGSKEFYEAALLISIFGLRRK